MILNHRPSILQRPVSSTAGKANEESADREFKRYQERLAALKTRAQQQERHLLESIYPPAGHAQDAATGAPDITDTTAQNDQENRFVQPQPERLVGGSSRMEHPWNLTPIDTGDEAREVAKRAAARDAMQQNKEMMEAKQRSKQLEKARERHGAAAMLQSEEAWWNRGATSERWIPPEYRLRGRAHTAGPQVASQGAADVFRWPDTTAAAPRESQRPVTSGSYIPYAPYATADNAPKPRSTSYRPRAPFFTEPENPAVATTTAASRPTTSGSLRPPFSLHDEAPAARSGPTAGDRMVSSMGNLPPYDNDQQPPLPPRRSGLRMRQRKPDRCPFDTTEDAKPLRRHSEVAYSATGGYQTHSSGHHENMMDQSFAPLVARRNSAATATSRLPEPAPETRARAPWRGVELSHTTDEDQAYAAMYGGREVREAMHAYRNTPPPDETNKEGRDDLPQYTAEEDEGRELAYAGENVDRALDRTGEVLVTNKGGRFDMPQYTEEENEGRQAMYAGEDVDRVMHRTPGQVLVTNKGGTFNMPQYTEHEDHGREEMYAGEDVDKIMHRTGEVLVSNKTGRFDMPQYTRQEDRGREHMYEGDGVDRALHRTPGQTLVTNKTGHFDMPQYTGQEDLGREQMYAGSGVEETMHRSLGQPLITNATGRFDMPQYTCQEDRGRERAYGGHGVDQVMHQSPGETLVTDKAAQFDMPQYTSVERHGMRDMFSGSGVGAALHMSPEPMVVNKSGRTEMPQYSPQEDLRRRSMYAGAGLREVMHADDGHRPPVQITNKYGRKEQLQHTGFEERGRKGMFSGDAVSALLHPAGDSSQHTYDHRQARDGGGVVEVTGTKDDHLRREIDDLTSKYGLR